MKNSCMLLIYYFHWQYSSLNKSKRSPPTHLEIHSILTSFRLLISVSCFLFTDVSFLLSCIASCTLNNRWNMLIYTSAFKELFDLYLQYMFLMPKIVKLFGTEAKAENMTQLLFPYIMILHKRITAASINCSIPQKTSLEFCSLILSFNF